MVVRLNNIKTEQFTGNYHILCKYKFQQILPPPRENWQSKVPTYKWQFEISTSFVWEFSKFLNSKPGSKLNKWRVLSHGGGVGILHHSILLI